MKLIVWTALIVLYTTATQGQNIIGDFPKDAQVGKCYIRAIVPAVYDVVKDSIEVKPAYRYSSTSTYRPTFKTIYDTIEVSFARRGYKKLASATSETNILVDSAGNKNQWIIRDSANISPCITYAKIDEIDAICLVPVFSYSSSRRGIVSPASFQEITIPPIYKIIKREILLDSASTGDIFVPAQYIVIEKYVLIRESTISDWREFLCCGGPVTRNKIEKIKMALEALGYKTGVPDNKLNRKTKKALLRFQKDNNLPQGNLNKETLEALGVL